MLVELDGKCKTDYKRWLLAEKIDPTSPTDSEHPVMITLTRLSDQNAVENLHSTFCNIPEWSIHIY
jgi:hypothetical protein